MKYFLDFDRTIFDTPAFKKAIARRPTVLELLRQMKEATKELVSPGESMSRRRSLAKTFGTFLSHGRFTISSEEVVQYLYPDVPDFLRTHDCTIVTYGVRAFITAKVSTTLKEFAETPIVYTSRRKGRTIKRLCAETDDKCTFIDDAHFQLESVSLICPTVTIVEMRRDGTSGDGRWKVIHSLADLG
jgi:hypothetical protein